LARGAYSGYDSPPTLRAYAQKYAHAEGWNTHGVWPSRVDASIEMFADEERCAKLMDDLPPGV